MTEPLWLTLGRELVGLGEIVGTKHEPKVVEFFADAGVPEIKNDETAWCGAFLAAMFVKAGRRDVRPPGDPYNALRAREWLKVGKPATNPLPGDIVVFSRGGAGATTGHVGFFVGETVNSVKVLGGNQSNQVSVASYPRGRVLGYRRVLPLPGAQPAPAPARPAPKSMSQPDDPGVVRGEKAAPKGLWAGFLAFLANPFGPKG